MEIFLRILSNDVRPGLSRFWYIAPVGSFSSYCLVLSTYVAVTNCQNWATLQIITQNDWKSGNIYRNVNDSNRAYWSPSCLNKIIVSLFCQSSSQYHIGLILVHFVKCEKILHTQNYFIISYWFWRYPHTRNLCIET